MQLGALLNTTLFMLFSNEANKWKVVGSKSLSRRVWRVFALKLNIKEFVFDDLN